jgi:hypothetical protein
MEEWIHFEKGEYLTEQSFLVAADAYAVILKNAIVEVYKGRLGIRQIKGRGLASNHSIIELLEDNDDIDLVLDFGKEFKYRLAAPVIQSGKFFTPGVESLLHFYPNTPWTQIPVEKFQTLIERLRFLDA